MTPPSAVLDERGRRRARVNAAAAHIAGRQKSLRALEAPTAGALRPTQRRRLHAGSEPRARPRRRSPAVTGAGVATLIGELAVLAGLFILPAFTPRSITVDGASLLPSEAIVKAAAVPSGSIFALDGDAVRYRLEKVPLLRSVKVTTSLPASVHITVSEWRPILRLVLPRTTLLVAENGGAVDAGMIRPGSEPSVPVMIDGRTSPRLAVPGQPLDPRFAQLLSATAAHFPAVFGTNVAAFEWQPDGILSIWSDHGWRAILGHVDTADQVAAVPSQLSALAALRGQLNFTSPQFGYVNLENPEALAVGGLVGLPPEVVAVMGVAAPAAAAPAAAPPAAAPTAAPAPAPTAAPTPAPTPLPTPKPAPTPAPTPHAAASPSGGPYVIYVPQPGGH